MSIHEVKAEGRQHLYSTVLDIDSAVGEMSAAHALPVRRDICLQCCSLEKRYQFITDLLSLSSYFNLQGEVNAGCHFSLHQGTMKHQSL